MTVVRPFVIACWMLAATAPQSILIASIGVVGSVSLVRPRTVLLSCPNRLSVCGRRSLVLGAWGRACGAAARLCPSFLRYSEFDGDCSVV